jgi:hypothetical protein
VTLFPEWDVPVGAFCCVAFGEAFFPGSRSRVMRAGVLLREGLVAAKAGLDW